MSKKQDNPRDILSSMFNLLGLEAKVEQKEKEQNIVLQIFSEEPGRIIGKGGMTIDALQLLINKMLRKQDESMPLIILEVDNGDKNEERTKRNSLRAEGSNESSGAKTEKTGEVNQPKTPKIAKLQKDKPKHEKVKKENSNEESLEVKEKKDRPKKDRPNRDRSSANQEISNLPDDRVEAISKQANEAAKEVKRWGEEVTLPAMTASERRVVHLVLEKDPEITTESIPADGGKKRVVVKSK